MPIHRTFLLLAAALCFLPGCAQERGARMAGPRTETRSIRPAFIHTHLSQIAGPRTGTWALTGRDRGEWQAEMVFTKQEGTQLEGYLNWRSVGGRSGGHERFAGSFSPKTGRVTLQGLELSGRRGDIATGATYEATVAAIGTSLRDGRWSGKGVEPGTWSAELRSREIPGR